MGLIQNTATPSVEAVIGNIILFKESMTINRHYLVGKIAEKAVGVYF